MSNYPPVPNYPPMQSVQKDSGLAIASLICGIGTYFIIPFFGALAAIILGHIAVNEINNSNGLLKGKGMATAGLVLGYVQIGLILLVVVILLLLAPTLGSVFSNISNGMSY
jgi:Domain of unknown function (DUF4190)